ncbi:MAG: hypothetical protein QM692_02540 [Thermomicrobiales bacterium]
MINAHAIETEAAFRRFEWERAISSFTRVDEATRRPTAARRFSRPVFGGWARTQAHITISIPWFTRQNVAACV